MADNKLYTIKDLARELDVGESTVRFWRDRFPECMPSVSQGKRKLYRKEALEALRFIQQESYLGRKSAEQIRHELSQQQPIEVDPEKSQRSAAAGAQKVSGEGGQELAPQFVDKLLERVQGILQTQNDRMATLETENRELRDRLARLEEQQKTAAPQQYRSAIAAAQQSRERVIAYLIHLRKEGMSFRKIAIRLNEEGISGLHGGRWDGKTVSRILQKNERK